MTAFTAVCHPNYRETCKKWDMTLSSSMAMYSVMHWWCKKGTNGKRMSCSLLIGHMQIFKSIDFRKTKGLWKWINFFLIHTVYADDTCLYFTAKDPNILQSTINNDLSSLSQWVFHNHLLLNVKQGDRRNVSRPLARIHSTTNTHTQTHLLPESGYKEAYGWKVINPNSVLQVNFHIWPHLTFDLLTWPSTSLYSMEVLNG